MRRPGRGERGAWAIGLALVVSAFTLASCSTRDEPVAHTLGVYGTSNCWKLGVGRTGHERLEQGCGPRDIALRDVDAMARVRESKGSLGLYVLTAAGDQITRSEGLYAEVAWVPAREAGPLDLPIEIVDWFAGDSLVPGISMWGLFAIVIFFLVLSGLGGPLGKSGKLDPLVRFAKGE